MNFTRGKLIYEGKAKVIYAVEGHDELIWQEFKDSLTAFNAQKKGSFEDKGHLNRDLCSLIFRRLQKAGIETHWVADLDRHVMITQRLEMVKLEVVVRNILAGSTAKKFGIEEGMKLSEPLTEFYYKDDALADPFMSDEQALMLKVATLTELGELKRLALLVNRELKEIFGAVGIDLVDFKIEFGRAASGKLLLADEISPDSCRLWDQKTKEKYDKDRFRRDLGNVKEGYQHVSRLVKEYWESRV